MGGKWGRWMRRGRANECEREGEERGVERIVRKGR